MMHDAPNTAKLLDGRRMLAFLLCVFMLPIIVVVGMYYLDVRPEGQSHGTLISPPQPLQLANLTTYDGNILPTTYWSDHWSLIYLSEGCEAECQSQVHLLRQVHVSMNKEFDRIQRLLVITGSTDMASLKMLQSKYTDLKILAGTDASAISHQLLTGDSAQSPEGAYLIDPLGNLMMRYGTNFDPKGLREDLTRLLKYSWVG